MKPDKKMEEIRQKIEEIVDNHFKAHPAPRNSGIAKLLTLYTEMVEEAVRGFYKYMENDLVEWEKRERLRTNSFVSADYRPLAQLKAQVETYLQTLKDKVDN